MGCNTFVDTFQILNILQLKKGTNKKQLLIKAVGGTQISNPNYELENAGMYTSNDQPASSSSAVNEKKPEQVHQTLSGKSTSSSDDLLPQSASQVSSNNKNDLSENIINESEDVNAEDEQEVRK